MKKLILFFVLVFGVAMAAQAQSCGSKASTAAASSCCSSKSKASTASADATPSIGADIEQRTNAAGEVSYVRKVVNTETGAVSFAEVEYCTKTNQFVDVASATAVEAKAGCSGEEKAASGCCSSKAKAEDTPPAKGKGKTKV